ncbi:unnamed protein product [Linum trigynum]|uniref:Uncharacterized protein n=1 Tax=Linum trigynum TaxID=586398 RepID=A0AAV2EWU9_9ROSI
MRILWNGKLSQSITPTRGVRQGDPLSPYLFVLCMERLSHKIDEACLSKKWKPIHLTKEGLPLTHLFFADDLLLFAEAESRQIKVVKECLDDFCYSSGQRVNYNKSIMYISSNVDRAKASLLSRKAGIPLKQELGKYLGIDTIHGRVTKGRYQGLILRIQKKLAPRKARRLSLAARLTIARSVTSSLPTYTMSTELIPSGVCKNIDKINRDFIWGEEEEKYKMHLVAWDKMVLPKKQGGAGLRSLRQANLAMLAKGGWRILKEKDSLWTKVMREKYGRGQEDLNIIRPIQGSSFTWNSFSRAANLLRKGCAWNIKKGKHTKFWLDVWILQVPLIDVAVSTIPSDIEGAVVADFVTQEGTWRTELFSDLLPQDVLQKILSTAVDNLSTEGDTMFWSASSDGKFSAKSAYSLLNQHTADPDEKHWKTIWQLPVPERVRNFMWVTLLGKIVTNLLRFSRKLAPNSDCVRCQGQPESILHILRDCPPALFFWTRHVPGPKQHTFFSADQHSWLRANLAHTDIGSLGMSWATFFSVAVWCLWKNRCTFVFKGASAALSPPTLAHSIVAKAKLWHQAWEAPTLLPNNRVQPATRVLASIGWNAPPAGWFSLNIDGASCGNPGPAGTGGCIRDSSGKWITGFVGNIGSATAALAELWAFFHGLEIAWTRGCRVLRIESDSKLAIELIQNRHDQVHPYSTLISAIRRKLSQNWLVSITHTYREGNRVADWLSKHSLVYPYGMHELANPPQGLGNILLEDSMGITFERRIVATSSTSSPSSTPM